MSNGHTNGNGNGNGKKTANGRKPCHLRIVLERKGADEDDVELLRQVWRLLSSWHGQDSYELCVATPHGRTCLRSEAAVTAFNTELDAGLKVLLGPNCLTVCDPAEV